MENFKVSQTELTIAIAQIYGQKVAGREDSLLLSVSVNVSDMFE